MQLANRINHQYKIGLNQIVIGTDEVAVLRPAPKPIHPFPVSLAKRIGTRGAEVHRRLATDVARVPRTHPIFHRQFDETRAGHMIGFATALPIAFDQSAIVSTAHETLALHRLRHRRRFLRSLHFLRFRLSTPNETGAILRPASTRRFIAVQRIEIIIECQLGAGRYETIREEANARLPVDSPLLRIEIGTATVVNKSSHISLGAGVDDQAIPHRQMIEIHFAATTALPNALTTRLCVDQLADVFDNESSASYILRRFESKTARIFRGEFLDFHVFSLGDSTILTSIRTRRANRVIALDARRPIDAIRFGTARQWGVGGVGGVRRRVASPTGTRRRFFGFFVRKEVG